MNQSPIAIVIDKAFARRKPKSLRLMLSKLGGSWPMMFEMWKESKAPYVIFLCHTTERFRQGAPLTFMPLTDGSLRQGLENCCQDLIGQRCRWLILMQPHSTGRDITESTLLLDIEVEGRA
jgi:hypothetical protein